MNKPEDVANASPNIEGIEIVKEAAEKSLIGEKNTQCSFASQRIQSNHPKAQTDMIISSHYIDSVSPSHAHMEGVFPYIDIISSKYDVNSSVSLNGICATENLPINIGSSDSTLGPLVLTHLSVLENIDNLQQENISMPRVVATEYKSIEGSNFASTQSSNSREGGYRMVDPITVQQKRTNTEENMQYQGRERSEASNTIPNYTASLNEIGNILTVLRSVKSNNAT